MKKSTLLCILGVVTGLALASGAFAHSETAVNENEYPYNSTFNFGVAKGDDDVLQVSVTATEPIKSLRDDDDDDDDDDIEDGDDESDDDRNDHATGTKRAEERASENAREALEKAEFHVDGDDMRDDSDVSDDDDIEDAEEVHSSADMESFISHKIKDDKRLKSVDVVNGKMEIEYEADAKLFGFMKTSVPARILADKEGNVTVKYPWYHIFVKKQHSSASLQSIIARAIAAERKAEKEDVATTTVRADITAAFGISDLFQIIAETLDGATEDK